MSLGCRQYSQLFLIIQPVSEVYGEESLSLLSLMLLSVDELLDLVIDVFKLSDCSFLSETK